MKNTTILITIGILALLVGGFLYMNGALSNGLKTSSGGSGDVQKITLSFKNYNYYPNTIRVNAGQPVSISLDSSVGGCYRSFTIRELGLSKYLQTPSDTLDFTPTEKGSYRFACVMGMGTGTLIVE